MSPLHNDDNNLRSSLMTLPGATTFLVKTVPQEDASSSRCYRQEAPAEDADTLRTTDPFLYYSNDAVRLRTLKYTTPVSDEELRQLLHATIASTRKSRISFEMHPTAVLEDELMALFGGEEGDTMNPAAADGDGAEVDDPFMALLGIKRKQ